MEIRGKWVFITFILDWSWARVVLQLRLADEAMAT